jgi:acid stress-induced BolA-like protein IbaG/YrbA
MVSLHKVEASIKDKLPDARVIVNDLTGGGDHLEAIVVSSEFTGKTRVKQHQLIYEALKEEMATEAIHALALKTYTPEAWQLLEKSA